MAAAAAWAVPTAGAGAAPAAETIAVLNAHRATFGAQPVTEDPYRTEGCRLHAEYMRLNGLVEHGEDPGRPGYTDEGDRAAGRSVLSGSGPEVVETWSNAPTHLMQTLNPWLRTTGAWDGCVDTLSDRRRELDRTATFGYPGDGTEYPARQRASEYPTVPAQHVGLDPAATTGPNLLFFVAGPGDWSDYLGRVVRASLVGPDGPVEVRTVDNRTETIGRFLAPGAIIIPVAPLRPGATYTASATFQPEGELRPPGSPAMPTQSHVWSFRATDATVGGRTIPTGGTGKVTLGPTGSGTGGDPDGPGSEGGGGGQGGGGQGAETRRRVLTVVLGRRRLLVHARNVATLRATVAERRTRTVRRGGRTTRRTSWIVVRRTTVSGLGGTAVRSKTFRALVADRRYRVVLRTGKGAVVDSRTLTARKTLPN